MPDAPTMSLDELKQMYAQQNPGKPPPAMGEALQEGSFIPDDQVNNFAGSPQAMDMLGRYNQFMQQQAAKPPGPPSGAAHTPASGTTLGPTGSFAPPPSGGGFPPAPAPLAVGGQGVIPAGVTPSAGLDNGNSLPPAPAGGHNMRIQNGSRIQDVQYTPAAAGGGVQATTMRDAATGLTFVQGPNGQFYPAGSPTGGGPGMGFGNAQTNVVGAGLDAATAANAGVSLNPVTAEALGRMRLAGVSPSSPVGQRMMQEAVGEWNHNQTALGVAQIAAGPANTQAQTVRDQFDPNAKLRDAEIRIDQEVSKEFPGADTATHNKIVAQRMEPYRKAFPVRTPAGNTAGPGSPPAPGQGPPPAAGAGGAIERMNAAAGPAALPADLENPLSALVPNAKSPTGASPALDIKNMMTKAYLYDRQNPGFMKGQGGKDLVARMQSVYGPDALQNAARVPPLQALTGRGTLGDVSNEDNAMSAWRDALGLPLEGNAAAHWLGANSPLSPLGQIRGVMDYFNYGGRPTASGFLK